MKGKQSLLYQNLVDLKLRYYRSMRAIKSELSKPSLPKEDKALLKNRLEREQEELLEVLDVLDFLDVRND